MLNRIRTLLGKSEFAKNVLVLSSGTVIAQAIPILISPILTRIYTPEDFATFGLFSALISVLGVIATGKYEFAIMLPDNERDAKGMAFVSTSIAVVFSTILLVVVLLFHDPILNFFGNHDLDVWLYFVPVSVLLTAVFQVLNFWSNRRKAYTALARSRVTRSLVMSSANLLFGFLKVAAKLLPSFGLIIGLMIGQLVEILMLTKFKGVAHIRKETAVSLHELKVLARRYINFPKFDVPSELMVTTSVQMPVLLFNRFFEKSVVGFYFYAHRILSMPLQVIGNAIGQVLYKQLSEARNNPALFGQSVEKAYDRLILLGIVPFALVGAFGRELFEIVFGKPWSEAGVFASLISPWLLFNFIGAPLTIIFSALEKQKNMFFWILSGFVIRMTALCLGLLYFNDVYFTVLMFGVAGALFYFSMNFYMVCILARVPTSVFLRSTFGKPVIILTFVLVLEYVIGKLA